MTRVILLPGVVADFNRPLDHMAAFAMENPVARTDQILHALEILQHSAATGRPVEGAKRELVIGRDSHAYVALYRFAVPIDTVFAIALRGQRERDFHRS
jgi:plasmid stabilization system protein ParE